MSKSNVHSNMRIWHRYLGFFLAGIMAIYALSGIVLIFRDTDFLKVTRHVHEKIKPGLGNQDLGKAVKIKDVKITSITGSIKSFSTGTYDTASGEAVYTVKALPSGVQKLTQLHKAKTGDPLFFLNVFFGVSLLFFVISSFWMFMPRTTIFKKGLYFTLAGVLLTILLLWMG